MEYKGSFTVEAVMLIPFLLLVSTVLIYMMIYVYDSVLIVQDVNSLIVSIREADDNKTTYNICEDKFAVMKAEHPFISLQDVELSIARSGFTNKVKISGEWTLPIWNSISKEISYEREAYAVRPIEVMHKTDRIIRLWEEYKDDDPDDV